MQLCPFPSMSERWCELLRKKHNGPEFFHKFEESYWNLMRRNCLSSHLGTGSSRANNGLECCNLLIKKNFTENVLLPVNEFVNDFRERASGESLRFSNLRANTTMKHVAGKTCQKAITRIRYV